MAVSQEDVVRKVQALWRKADDPAASEHEKEQATIKARKLMAKWAINEIVLAEASPTHEEVIVADILLFEIGDDEDIDEAEAESLVPDQRMMLAHYIAMNSRCKDIIVEKEASIYADGSAQLHGNYMVVFGFRSDVRMVELLYTTLVADMILAFYKTKLRHVKAASKRENIMKNFCEGYVKRIATRLVDISREFHEAIKSDGSLLPVLRDRSAAVIDKFDAMYPPEETTKVAVKGVKYDPGAHEAGAAAADKADLGGKKIGVKREALGR